MPSTTSMTAEAFRLARIGHFVEASDVLLNAARLSADEAGYTALRCGCERFIARNELRCFEVLGECSICFSERHPPHHP